MWSQSANTTADKELESKEQDLHKLTSQDDSAVIEPAIVDDYAPLPTSTELKDELDTIIRSENSLLAKIESLKTELQVFTDDLVNKLEKRQDILNSFHKEIVKCGSESDLESFVGIQDQRKDYKSWEDNIKSILLLLENEVVYLKSSVECTSYKERETKLMVYKDIENGIDKIREELSKEVERVISSFQDLADKQPVISKLCSDLKDCSNTIDKCWSDWKQCYVGCESKILTRTNCMQEKKKILDQLQERGEKEPTLLSCSIVTGAMDRDYGIRS